MRFLPLRYSAIPLFFVYYVQIVFGHFFVLCASRQARVSFSSFTGQSDCPFPFGIPVFRDTEIPFFHPTVLCSQMSLRASAPENCIFWIFLTFLCPKICISQNFFVSLHSISNLPANYRKARSLKST